MNLGPLFQSLGDVGNQYGGAKIQAAQLKLKQFLDSLKAKQETVSLDDMQERLKRLKASPENEDQKFQQTLTAFRNTFKREPDENEKRLLFGLPAAATSPTSVKDDIEKGLAELPEGQRKVVEPAVRAYLDAGQPDKAMQVFASVAEKFQSEPKTMEPLKGEGGGTYGFRVGGKALVPGSEGWTDDLQKALDAAVRQDLADQKRKDDLETRRENAAMSRLLKALDARQQANLMTQYDKAKKDMKPWERTIAVGDRAQGYVQSPSGPGDVALMLAYVEATKPETGFRFTTAEQNLIMQSRGYIEGARARLEKGYSGTLFGETGSDQRKIIGDIIQKATSQAKQQKEQYLNGKKLINPDLYEILTNSLGSDFTPE